jgi:hypothetical protein
MLPSVIRTESSPKEPSTNFSILLVWGGPPRSLVCGGLIHATGYMRMEYKTYCAAPADISFFFQFATNVILL